MRPCTSQSRGERRGAGGLRHLVSLSSPKAPPLSSRTPSPTPLWSSEAVEPEGESVRRRGRGRWSGVSPPMLSPLPSTSPMPPRGIEAEMWEGEAAARAGVSRWIRWRRSMRGACSYRKTFLSLGSDDNDKNGGRCWPLQPPWSQRSTPATPSPSSPWAATATTARRTGEAAGRRRPLQQRWNQHPQSTRGGLNGDNDEYREKKERNNMPLPPALPGMGRRHGSASWIAKVPRINVEAAYLPATANRGACCGCRRGSPSLVDDALFTSKIDPGEW